jgi:hypothetical protein
MFYYPVCIDILVLSKQINVSISRLKVVVDFELPKKGSKGLGLSRKMTLTAAELADTLRS